MSKYYNWKSVINKQELQECANIINNDGIIIFPTETVYGIGANAVSQKAVQKIYQIKRRPINKAINIMVSDIKEIAKYAIIKNDIEKTIIEEFMPGPITIILEKKQIIPDIVTAGSSKIGIRIPQNKIALKILEQCKNPIAAPSANISGEQSGINIQQIKDDFEGKVDVFIDGGTSDIAKASTIVEVVENNIIIHRQGIITKNDILDVLNSRKNTKNFINKK